MEQPDALAPSGVWLQDRFVPAAALRERAARVAGALQAQGVRAGDVIAVFARNAPAMIEVALGAARVGATIAPVNAAWRAQEVRYLLTDSRARLLIGQLDLVRRVLAGLPDGLDVVTLRPLPEVVHALRIADADLAPLPQFTDYDDWLDRSEPLSGARTDAPVSSLFYTSGTTGQPKGVLRAPATPEQAVHRMKVLQTCYGIDEGARSLITTPLYHLFASAHAQTTLAKNGTVVLMPHFDPQELLATIERHRITHAQMVPTMFIRLLQLPEEVRRRYDVSSLRHVLHTGAPCPPEVKRRMIDWWGPVIWEMYGASETGSCVLCDSLEWLAHPGCVGRPYLGSQVAVYGPDGQRVAPGVVGDIYMRMPGSPDFTYLGRDDARREIERDGLINAGDVGYLDQDGYLHLSDRRADVVISGGTNIYPAEIEAVLASLPGVRDCAVVGIPHEEFGEQLAAYVVRDPEVALDAQAVQSWVRERLAGYKVPRVVGFVDALPRDDGGKILRRKVRERFASAPRSWN